MTEILSDEAITELEKRIDAFPLSPFQARALCATVKHLRAEVEDWSAWHVKEHGPCGHHPCHQYDLRKIANNPDAAHGCASCEVINLQSQLEQLRAENVSLNKPRMFPIQDGAPAVRWELAEKAYTTYAKLFGTDQSLQRLAERGGFGLGEFACLYLGHDPRCKSVKACIEQVEAEIGYVARLQSRLAQVEQERDELQRQIAEATVTAPWAAGYSEYVPTAGDPIQSVKDLMLHVQDFARSTCAREIEKLRDEAELEMRNTDRHSNSRRRASITMQAYDKAIIALQPRVSEELEKL